MGFVLVLGMLIAPAVTAGNTDQMVLPNTAGKTRAEILAPIFAAMGITEADLTPVATTPLLAVPDTQERASVAACITVAAASFAFGYVAPVPPPPIGVAGGCGYTIFTTGNNQAVMACGQDPTSFCLAFAFNFDWSTFSYGFWEAYCIGPGAFVADWTTGQAQAAPTCFAFIFGNNPTTWNNWYGFQENGIAGAMITVATVA